HLLAEGDAVEFVEHSLVETLADAIGLRALGLGARVIDILDCEVELVLVPLWIAAILAAAVVAQPHTTHAGGCDHKPAPAPFVGPAKLSEPWLPERGRRNGLPDLLGYAILQHRLLAADLLQR